MRLLLLIVTGLFVVYTGIQSLIIAQAGVTYKIPQLEGDGGAGFVFAVLCFIAAVLLFIQPLAALVFYALAAGIIAFVAVTFNDTLEFAWSLGATALAVFSVYIRHRERLVAKKVKTN